MRHLRWRQEQQLIIPRNQTVSQEMIESVRTSRERGERSGTPDHEFVRAWSLRPHRRCRLR